MIENSAMKTSMNTDWSNRSSPELKSPLTAVSPDMVARNLTPFNGSSSSPIPIDGNRGPQSLAEKVVVQPVSSSLKWTPKELARSYQPQEISYMRAFVMLKDKKDYQDQLLQVVKERGQS